MLGSAWRLSGRFGCRLLLLGLGLGGRISLFGISLGVEGVLGELEREMEVDWVFVYVGIGFASPAVDCRECS